jgi:BASS family bile acid:Na+ symporter
MALVVPVALPFLVGAAVKISIWEVLQPVLIVMFVPLILARLVTHLPQSAQVLVQRGKPFSFPIWLLNLFIISAKAADFLGNEHSASLASLAAVALVSLIICAINFALGAWLGGPQYRQEASQALGQKNNSFVIWVALTFLNPLVAMGPTFYVLYHNLYNSWQIYLFEKRRKNV